MILGLDQKLLMIGKIREMPAAPSFHIYHVTNLNYSHACTEHWTLLPTTSPGCIAVKASSRADFTLSASDLTMSNNFIQ